MTSSPAQWPGVKFFLSILTASNKDGSHHLKLLLCEAAVAVYLSMLVSACSRLACNTLYRFVINNLSEDMWNAAFGGGTKIVVPAPANLAVQSGGHSFSYGISASSLGIATSSPKKTPPSSTQGEKKVDPTRMRWNYKLLGKKANEVSEDGQKLFRHELYVPPERSLCDHILRKVGLKIKYILVLTPPPEGGVDGWIVLQGDGNFEMKMFHEIHQICKIKVDIKQVVQWGVIHIDHIYEIKSKHQKGCTVGCNSN